MDSTRYEQEMRFSFADEVVFKVEDTSLYHIGQQVVTAHSGEFVDTYSDIDMYVGSASLIQ